MKRRTKKYRQRKRTQKKSRYSRKHKTYKRKMRGGGWFPAAPQRLQNMFVTAHGWWQNSPLRKTWKDFINPERLSKPPSSPKLPSSSPTPPSSPKQSSPTPKPPSSPKPPPLSSPKPPQPSLSRPLSATKSPNHPTAVQPRSAVAGSRLLRRSRRRFHQKKSYKLR